jgi:hypothetical protein
VSYSSLRSRPRGSPAAGLSRTPASWPGNSGPRGGGGGGRTGRATAAHCDSALVGVPRQDAGRVSEVAGARGGPSAAACRRWRRFREMRGAAVEGRVGVGLTSSNQAEKYIVPQMS